MRQVLRLGSGRGKTSSNDLSHKTHFFPRKGVIQRWLEAGNEWHRADALKIRKMCASKESAGGPGWWLDGENPCMRERASDERNLQYAGKAEIRRELTPPVKMTGVFLA